MFIQIFLQQESFSYQKILSPVKDVLLLFVSMDVIILRKKWLKETLQVIMISLQDLQPRASSFMRPKILIVGKINTVGSHARRIRSGKHFSHLLFLNMNKLFIGCNRFLLLIVAELLFMVLAMEAKLPCVCLLC